MKDGSGTPVPAKGSRSIDKFGSGARRCSALLVNFFPKSRQARAQLVAGCAARRRTCAHHEIQVRQVMLIQPEGFTDDSTHAIALDGVTGDANRHGEAQSRPTLVIPESNHAEKSITKPPPARVGGLEVRFAAKAPVRRQSQP